MKYSEIFSYFADEHNLTLIETQAQDIESFFLKNFSNELKELVKEMRTAQKASRKATKDDPNRRELFQKANFLEKQVDEITGIGNAKSLF